MINLLPDAIKQETRAARANVVLLRYVAVVLSVASLLVVLCGAFYLMLNSIQTSAVSTTSENAAKAQDYAAIRTKVDEYKSNLTIAKQILNSSVNYSSFIFKLTELLPSGAILDNLTLDDSSFNQQTTFTIRATSFDKATEIKDRFQKSSLFSNVYLQTLVDDSQSSDGGTKNKHSVIVTISAKINKDIQP